MPATAVATPGGAEDGSVSSTAAPSSSSTRSSPGRNGGVALLKTMVSVRNIAASADSERKRRLIQRVPILKQLLREQHCTEAQLITALRIVNYVDGEYIYCQGHVERDIYFIEDGKVLITQRRLPSTSAPASSAVGAVSTIGPSRRRSVQDAELEIQINTHNTNEYFGELTLLQNKPVRKWNAVASGAVVCLVLLERDYDTLLKPLHPLLLYRHLLRAHCVLEKDRMFKEWSPSQRQFLIDHCQLQDFANGDLICRQGEIDDKYFVLAEGEADVVVEEAALSAVLGEFETSIPKSFQPTTMSTVVARKSIFQGFGEMGLLDKPRTASVVAVGTSVLCVVITRKNYIAAAQLGANGVVTAMDVDAEALLATTLIEEWKLVINARNLHLSNPQVAHYLVTFIKKFKAAYNQKFAGKTLYLDFFRRLHQEPSLTEEFEFVSSRVAWDSPASSLGIIRSETRRVLSKQPSQRTADETSFVGRLIETTAFIGKFDVPGPHVDRYKLSRCLARVVTFANIAKDDYLFRQGKIESRAFLILRGKINIVNEDVMTSSSTIKHHEVIATLSAGDSFGELSLVTRLQRSATTMAASDTDLLVFDREHLLYVQSVLPGVSVQQLMVKRAEFLSRLSFFRGCDFGQCIRVAHDLQEVVYEARHLFMQESTHQRTLFIVKSGEIAVFMRTNLPATSSAVATKEKAKATRVALVRVATIGAQEFFGVAIATVNTGATTNGQIATPMTNAPNSGSFLSANSSFGVCDLSAAVYMSITRVVMLELSERGWRRLSPHSLNTIRNALLERHRWNETVAQNHQRPASEQNGAVVSYYNADKPWQLLLSQVVPCAADSLSNPNGGERVCVSRRNSQLARHVNEKQARVSPFSDLFLSPRTVESKIGVRCTEATTGTLQPTHMLAACGWGGDIPSPLSSFPSSVSTVGSSVALSPLVSFSSSRFMPPTASTVASVDLNRLPNPPRDRHTLLSIANISPRSAALASQSYKRENAGPRDAKPTEEVLAKAMWKAQTQVTGNTAYHAP